VYSQLLLGLDAPDSGGAPDSVRCARRVQGEPAALGTRQRRTAIERELGLHLFPKLILVVELPNTNNWTN
jgi:hypothetical protein